MLKIVTVPNKILTSPNKPVVSFDSRLKKLVKETGIRLLYNERQKVFVNEKDYFWLLGTEDSFYGTITLGEVAFKLPLAEPKILLTHSPNTIDYVKDYAIDLVLVGKTHGGQIGVKRLRDIFYHMRKFKYISGLYKVNDAYLYVNRGAGGKTSSYRFLCRPEIAVITIGE